MENLQDATTWKIRPNAFRGWSKPHISVFGPGFDPEPSLKSLVFLALLSADESGSGDRKGMSYRDIGELFSGHSVVDGSVPVASLRVAVSELGRTLDKLGHRFQLEATRRRREAFFYLRERSASPIKRGDDGAFLFLDPLVADGNSLALDLMQNRQLPFYSLYTLPRSAAWWVIFSSGEAEQRKPYEMLAWTDLGIKDFLRSGEGKTDKEDIAGLVGLGVGEGIAELELLELMLAEFGTVHYLAVDTSPVLLLGHVQTLRERFDQQLKAGNLVCAAVLGNALMDLEEPLRRARSEFEKPAREQTFLPSSIPVLVSYLGNNIGNDQIGREWSLFSSVRRAFSNANLAWMVGFSINQKDDTGKNIQERYERNWDDFLVQTPHHLMADLKLIESTNCDADELPEFVLPDERGSPGYAARFPTVVPKPYSAGIISGQVYDFYYVLSHDLVKPWKGQDIRVPKGSKLLLYNIIKYDPGTLVNFLEEKGLRVQYDPRLNLKVKTANGEREYGVLAAFRVT
jgi:hypothetical protein